MATLHGLGDESVFLMGDLARRQTPQHSALGKHHLRMRRIKHKTARMHSAGDGAPRISWVAAGQIGFFFCAVPVAWSSYCSPNAPDLIQDQHLHMTPSVTSRIYLVKRYLYLTRQRDLRLLRAETHDAITRLTRRLTASIQPAACRPDAQHR
ncbi:hypothetical protein BKA58DRAFT_194301 [Alternaria rosae]|uniref:uncharacterized protein n=1 Tax=Alternaria rosae TaxID=1187941 RepID=UPI001E8EB8AD|nr:uncharacterized protein BKA58DRAFT_194301 [Alternaria rosae]KAH6868393.1 hypothetical protein BKA58DRAFT_194301 [Alternaria rosae]